MTSEKVNATFLKRIERESLVKYFIVGLSPIF